MAIIEMKLLGDNIKSVDLVGWMDGACAEMVYRTLDLCEKLVEVWICTVRNGTISFQE